MTATLTPGPPDWRNFVVGPDRAATAPPEQRGLRRDGVRLLVASSDGIRHASFHDLADYLSPGDLIVVNDSATIPAALDIRRGSGESATLHLSARTGHTTWVVEVRSADRQRVFDVTAGETLLLPGGRTAVLLRAWPPGGPSAGARLWEAALSPGDHMLEYLGAAGWPITYDHITSRWPLAMYQTIFAREPGSAEMPSATRPFSSEVVEALESRGVGLAMITLHTGVSSAEAGEPPPPERFSVPEGTAQKINAARARGGRIIASGTTVTRALETVAGASGEVSAGGGWTDLVLGDRRTKVVNGLITGWHEPESSHLRLLEAVAGAGLVAAAYAAAVDGHYLWHEFGDSCLLLPD